MSVTASQKERRAWALFSCLTPQTPVNVSPMVLMCFFCDPNTFFLLESGSFSHNCEVIPNHGGKDTLSVCLRRAVVFYLYRGSLCRLGWLGTHYADQAGLKQFLTLPPEECWDQRYMPPAWPFPSGECWDQRYMPPCLALPQW